jgi:coenzyme Q-binding protein COQ10
MPSFSTERRVPFSPEQMFALVADIERYPDFVPLCKGLNTTSRRERDGRSVLVAEMAVGYKSIVERFTTQVYLQPEERVIDTKYVEGPFRYLTSQWRFEPVSEGCLVRFSIDYEFRNRMLGALMGAVFDRAFRTTVEAFEKRARAIYGTSAAGRSNASAGSPTLNPPS